MRTRPRIPIPPMFFAFVAVLAVAVALVASPAMAAPTLTRVSGPSPYASCTATATAGTNYVNAEVEPYLAINPQNSNNRIGVWQQDRISTGGARGLVAGFSSDGGATWSQTPLPFSACAGWPSYQVASDPWVSIGPDGTAYTVALSFNASDNSSAIVAATSRDGGQTWGDRNIIKADTSLKYFNDKESVTADPTRPGVAYVVWDRLESPNENPQANMHTFAFRGPSWFSKTTDGGATWSVPKIIVDFTPSRQQTIGNHIVVDPRNGTLYNFFDLISPPLKVGRYKVAFVKSTDAGNTWSKPKVVADLRTVFVTHPNTGQNIRTGDILPAATIDPSSGQLYVVWQDSRFNGGRYDEIALSTSQDGGATWSTPVQVNKPTGRPAFTPSVAVNSAGVVGVTYYDFRSLGTQTSTLPTDYWLTTSSNGGTSFDNDNETQLTRSFDMITAPDSRGFFVGDYQGLSSVGTSFVPFFVRARLILEDPPDLSNRTDVFTASAP